MEPLESALMDELLRDFSGDLLPPTPPSQRRRRAPGGTGAAPQAPPRPEEEHRLRSPVPAATPIMHPSLLDGPAVGSALEPFPAFVEEDLEWLSNKDAFPTLDTFDISACREPSPPPPPPAANPKRPSPVSVLDGVALPVAAPVPPSLKWATGRARSKGRRRRKRPLQVFHPRADAPPPAREKRRCWHCQAEDTPQWRAGPHGPKTLCNACGVRYKSGRLLPEYRPANSPTFSSNLHSNSHRKVMEMRRKKEVGLHPASAAPATMTKKKGLLAV